MPKLLPFAAASVMLLPSAAHAAELNSAAMSWPWALPFLGILLCIATGPLLFANVWHHHYGKFAFALCRAFCPGSQTELYYGSDIAYATARDGSRYADLDVAFVYRQRLVGGCTCNGHDPFGLAHIDAATDPTLKPGDVVVTKNGLTAFAGMKDGAPQFTPAVSYAGFSRSYRNSLADMRVAPPAMEPPGETISLPAAARGDGRRNAAN